MFKVKKVAKIAAVPRCSTSATEVRERHMQIRFFFSKSNLRQSHRPGFSYMFEPNMSVFSGVVDSPDGFLDFSVFFRAIRLRT